MQNKYDFEAVDRTLRDIRNCEEPFGGLSVILGGDFAQILPVVKRANRARTVAANL
jgi:ATP-dependent DNA helicase PIF1